MAARRRSGSAFGRNALPPALARAVAALVVPPVNPGPEANPSTEANPGLDDARRAWMLVEAMLRWCRDAALPAGTFGRGPEDGRTPLAEAARRLGSVLDPCLRSLEPANPPDGRVSWLTALRAELAAPDDVWPPARQDTDVLRQLYLELADRPGTGGYGRLAPDEVNAILLDLALDPALEEALHRDERAERAERACGVDGADQGNGVERHGGRSLSALRVVDPYCGSGDLVLGAFARVLEAWRRADPGADPGTLVRRALGSVHAADPDPLAVAVTRFRLSVAAAREGGALGRDEPPWPVTVVLADVLTQGRGVPLPAPASETLFDLAGADPPGCGPSDEDPGKLFATGSYHVVISWPPDRTARDALESRNWRLRYEACTTSTTLPVALVQRAFQLAVKTGGEDRDAGWVAVCLPGRTLRGESGRRLVERFLPSVHLTRVVGLPPARNTASARSPVPVSPAAAVTHAGPGAPAVAVTHAVSGAPAVVLVGRHHPARWGEPVRFGDAEVPRRALLHHPWSPDGDALRPLLARIEVGARAHEEAGKQGEDAAGTFWAMPDAAESVGGATAGGPVGGATAGAGHAVRSADHGRAAGLRVLTHSSVAGFWSARAPRGGGGRRIGSRQPVRDLPVPEHLPAVLSPIAQTLDALARRMTGQEPSALCRRGTPSVEVLDGARAAQYAASGRMVALQEEADWRVLAGYGLLTQSEAAAVTLPQWHLLPPIDPQQRACVLAAVQRDRIATTGSKDIGNTDTGSTDAGAGSTDAGAARMVNGSDVDVADALPGVWPEGYRRVVRARIDLLRRNGDLGMIERIEHKRPWDGDSWDDREREAVRAWLLARCDHRELWFGARADGVERPRPVTVAELAARIGTDPDVRAVADLYAGRHLGRPGLALDEVLGELVADLHVPWLAALRLTPSGLAKRARGAATGARTGRGTRRGETPDTPSPEHAPPRYRASDFTCPSYWALRGRNDEPTERFVSYPPLPVPVHDLRGVPDEPPRRARRVSTGSGNVSDASGVPSSDDPDLLLGWASWDVRERVQVLLDLVAEDRGLTPRRAAALLAGVRELQPELRRERASSAAARCAAILREQCARFGLTLQDLDLWCAGVPDRNR